MHINIYSLNLDISYYKSIVQVPQKIISNNTKEGSCIFSIQSSLITTVY